MTTAVTGVRRDEGCTLTEVGLARAVAGSEMAAFFKRLELDLTGTLGSAGRAKAVRLGMLSGKQLRRLVGASRGRLRVPGMGRMSRAELGAAIRAQLEPRKRRVYFSDGDVEFTEVRARRLCWSPKHKVTASVRSSVGTELTAAAVHEDAALARALAHRQLIRKATEMGWTPR